MVWLIAFHCGLDPAVSLGIAIGTFVGLASLSMELAIVGRSMRSVERNGMQATLMTFGIRLGTVASLGGWFLVLGAVDSEAFCLSYFATFFLYMCWLTWRIYNEPVHFDPAKAKGAPPPAEKKPTASTRPAPVGGVVVRGVA